MIFIPCDICGSEEWEVRYESTLLAENGLNPEVFRCTSNSYGQHPQIVQCRQCGHVYTNPRWTEDELIAAYTTVVDDVYQVEKIGRERTFKEHLKELEAAIGPANGRALLDVGTYIGVFVEVALAAGWKASGIEPSRWAVDIAAQNNLPVNQGTLDDLLDKEPVYDVITMWDVIEHLSDPKGDLTKVNQLLRPNGYLVLHTMDIDSRAARIMGHKWPWLMDMHLHYFSQESLGRLLEDVGFEVLQSGPRGRYLRLGYLASRLEGFNKTLGRLTSRTVDALKLDERVASVNFGDLFTVYAKKPGDRT